MADYRELVQGINRQTSAWDFHITTCRQCAVWYYFGKGNSPPTAETLCEEGLQIVQRIVQLLS